MQASSMLFRIIGIEFHNYKLSGIQTGGMLKKTIEFLTRGGKSQRTDELIIKVQWHHGILDKEGLRWICLAMIVDEVE